MEDALKLNEKAETKDAETLSYVPNKGWFFGHLSNVNFAYSVLQVRFWIKFSVFRVILLHFSCYILLLTALFTYFNFQFPHYITNWISTKLLNSSI